VAGGSARSPVGDAQTELAQVTGEFQTPHRTHAVVTDDGSALELVRVAGSIYTRGAATQAALTNVAYVRADTQASRLMHVRAEQARSLDLAALLLATTDAKILRQRGAATIVESDLAPALVFGPALAKHVAWSTLQVLIAEDGRVEGLRLVTRAEATITNRLQFAEWGADDIAVAAPPAAQIDATPPVAAAKLAALKTALVMPQRVPAGWELVRAGVLSATDTEEGCAQAELAYEDQAHDKAGYLYLYEFPRACSAAPEGGTTPFAAGDYRGFRATAGDPYVQITVGETIVQAVSDLSPTALAQTLSGLVPLALQSA
jgi:hypothetical protein